MQIRLGKEGEEPEFGRFAWFAMLFQAGMGIGLVFWGVSEPVMHLTDPPFDQAPANSAGAAQLALQYSFFHWALHPWAIYAVVGLAMAYVNFRKDLPGLHRHLCDFGDFVRRRRLFGVGTLQIGAGFDQTFGIPNGIGLQLIIIAVTAAGYMISASTPIEKGVNRLSQASIYVAAVVLLFFLIVGPTVTQINAFTQGTGDYIGDLIPMSFRLNAFGEDTPWLGE